MSDCFLDNAQVRMMLEQAVIRGRSYLDIWALVTAEVESAYNMQAVNPADARRRGMTSGDSGYNDHCAFGVFQIMGYNLPEEIIARFRLGCVALDVQVYWLAEWALRWHRDVASWSDLFRGYVGPHISSVQMADRLNAVEVKCRNFGTPQLSVLSWDALRLECRTLVTGYQTRSISGLLLLPGVLAMVLAVADSS